MAGQPLKRARQRAIADMDDETARRLAAEALADCNDSQLLVYAVERLRQLGGQSASPITLADRRRLAVEAITADQSLARAALAASPGLVDRHMRRQ